MGIPMQLHKFKWLYADCNQLTQDGRGKIVQYMTGKYSQEGVEKEDVLLNRVDEGEGVIKDSVFRMLFKTKNWKKVTLKRRLKKKTG